MSYQIVYGAPDVQGWMNLRASVGWPTFPEETALTSLSHTLYCVCAYDTDGRLIGMARVLGDGAFTFYIGNVMVCPDRQHEGIGRDIMGHIMDWVEEHACPGAAASLLSMPGREDFYEHFGFSRRPDEGRGSGMSRYY